MSTIDITEKDYSVIRIDILKKHAEVMMDFFAQVSEVKNIFEYKSIVDKSSRIFAQMNKDIFHHIHKHTISERMSKADAKEYKDLEQFYHVKLNSYYESIYSIDRLESIMNTYHKPVLDAIKSIESDTDDIDDYLKICVKYVSLDNNKITNEPLPEL